MSGERPLGDIEVDEDGNARALTPWGYKILGSTLHPGWLPPPPP